jgi:hypothetical protein
MIARKQSADVFVLGEEALPAPLPVGQVESTRAVRDSGQRKRRTRARVDPFRIDVDGLEEADVSAASPGSERTESRGRTRVEQPGWLRAGGVVLAALVGVLTVGGMESAKLLGGSARETGDSPTAVAETPVSVQPAQRIQASVRTNLKRDSRPRPTRGREGQTPRPRASSRRRPAAATPSTPVAATPSPPSQGGASGGRDNFGFEG